MSAPRVPCSARRWFAVLLLAIPPAALGQTVAPDSPAPSPGSPPAVARSVGVPGMSALSWLEGCWKGSVSNREFREVWLPQRGAMMLGVSQTVTDDKTTDFEYLRIEPRGDAAYYVVSPPGKPESAFRLSDEVVDIDGSHTYVFLDPARDFPRRIGYRRGGEGWLYTEVEGKVNGADRRVIYPMRRIQCESGAVLAK
ncbi:MAG: DUF6265 family protein [Pseudomonadota bacterium]|nr:DUF6265 family protein [Pseudomonadota bacterium]